ncbi:MAG: hypothetical protein MJZ55_05200 [Paludibacteraceae bacterium]|nr:hypothetical protein [Paludibacteraceae bacterium]
MKHYSIITLCIVLCALSIGLTSCKVHESLAKADLIGFSSDLQPSYAVRDGGFKNWFPQGQPIDVLTNNETFMQYVNKVTTDDNTALYYAADVAIDRMRYIRRKEVQYDPQTLYYIFLISDGLDNASVKVAHNHHQAVFTSNSEKYQKRIARRLKNAMGLSHNHLTVYPMVLKGEDLRQVQQNNKMSDAQFDNYLREQFACFRYSTRTIVPEVNIHTSFDAIYKQLEDEFLHSEYTFRVAKDYVNKTIRMTVKNDKGETAQIEGTLKRTGLSSYKMQDIKFTGLTADMTDSRFVSANHLDLKSQQDAFRSQNVYFVVPDMRSAKSNTLFLPEETIQEYKNGEVWQQNTEYTKQAIAKPNTYCMFLLDASTSMGKDLQDAKACIRKIMDMINR